MALFSQITSVIDNALYGLVLVFLLAGMGIFFSIRTGFVQIRLIKDMFTQLFEKKLNKGSGSMSSFQSMIVSTAARVGTGNIAGIATAITLGGPGSVLWMWILALFSAASAFIESTLAQLWKVKGEKEGAFRGGPAYYIQYALNKRWLGVAFSVLLISTYTIGFNGLQAYNMTSSLEYFIPDYETNGTTWIVGIILVILLSFASFGGVRRISRITSVMVPIMAGSYIIFAIIITIFNAELLPACFATIFKSAFDWEAIIGGFTGSVIMYGAKRGLLSNEAGMGSAPNAAASASVSHPAKQGLVQSLSVYIDSFLVCTSSAMVVMIFCV